MDNRTIEEVRRNEDRLIKENENLKAQIDLHCGTLKREHEAIKKLSELEEESAKLLKQNEILMKDSNTLQNLEMYLKENLDYETDIFSVIRIKDILDKIKEFKGELNDN